MHSAIDGLNGGLDHLVLPFVCVAVQPEPVLPCNTCYEEYVMVFGAERGTAMNSAMLCAESIDGRIQVTQSSFRCSPLRHLHEVTDTAQREEGLALVGGKRRRRSNDGHKVPEDGIKPQNLRR